MARSNYSYQKRAKELEKKKKKEAKKLRKLEKNTVAADETVETPESDMMEAEGVEADRVESLADQGQDAAADETSVR